MWVIVVMKMIINEEDEFFMVFFLSENKFIIKNQLELKVIKKNINTTHLVYHIIKNENSKSKLSLKRVNDEIFPLQGGIKIFIYCEK
jgi:hypothetical protein